MLGSLKKAGKSINPSHIQEKAEIECTVSQSLIKSPPSIFIADEIKPLKVITVLKSSVYKKMSHIEKLNLAIKNTLSIDKKIRPINSKNEPGGLVEFPEDDFREMIIAGDIHANKRNLKAILQDSKNLYKLEKNEAVLIFLGDVVHDERTGHLKEMDSSIEIMDIVIHLINKFPNNVIYLLGNHDTLSPQLAKSGILQGVIYHEALIHHRGEEYAGLMNKLFDSLPVFVKHKYFLAVHAGPVRGGIGKGELINLKAYPECHHQLTWNRINEFHSTPSRKEYSHHDLDDLRHILKTPENIPIFVGHNPLWKCGGENTVWVNPLQTHDHVILYCGVENVCPYISVKNSFEYEIKYANLKLKKSRFFLRDQ